MKAVGHREIIGFNYFFVSDRLAILIEETLRRNRKVVAVTITAGVDRFYGSVFWTEEGE